MPERKSAIVTGSATGVGAATALMLAQRGYDVLINYSKSEREARESEAACRAAGADTLLMQGDVADDAACRALARGGRRPLEAPRRAGQQRRRHHLQGRRPLGRDGCAGVPAHHGRQRARHLPDGARLCAAPAGRARRDRQRVVDRRRLGHRLVGALHRVEGRGQLDDAALRARAGAAGARQRRLPGADHHPLVRRWRGAAELREDQGQLRADHAAANRSQRRRRGRRGGVADRRRAHHHRRVADARRRPPPGRHGGRCRRAADARTPLAGQGVSVSLRCVASA